MRARRATFANGYLAAVDKPKGLTSHDVVSRIRHALGGARVGHAGTLDPGATGVLVVGVGPATRLLGLLVLNDKTYDARISFGCETTTDDAAGDITRAAEVPSELSNPAYAARELAALVGEHEQVPPTYCAISVGGKRSYAKARAGEELHLSPRPISVYEAKLIEIEGDLKNPVWHCSFHVSKGTYVRAIARDLGRKLGCAAHLADLKRSTSGYFTLDMCMQLSDIQQRGEVALRDHMVDPVRALGLALRLLDESELGAAASGRALPQGLVLDIDPKTSARGLRKPHQHELVTLVFGNELKGVWSCQGEKLQPKTNIPAGVMGVRP